MIKIIAAASAVITWSILTNVQPKDAAIISKATISPFEIMAKQGKNIPVEEHQDAF